MEKLTQKEFDLINRHILQDISYNEGGTFYKENSTEEVDIKEMERAKKILIKIEENLVKF